MSGEDVGDDLERNGLQRGVAFGEAVQEQCQILFGQVLSMLAEM